VNFPPMQPSSGDPIGSAIVIIGAATTLWTIFVAIYWTIRPGETEVDHPKRLILRADR